MSEEKGKEHRIFSDRVLAAIARKEAWEKKKAAERDIDIGPLPARPPTRVERENEDG